jgi:hypothetical protein
MKLETVINGDTKMVIIPESDLDKEILKVISAQKNEIIEVRNGFQIGAVTHTQCLLIQKLSTGNVLDENLF